MISEFVTYLTKATEGVPWSAVCKMLLILVVVTAFLCWVIVAGARRKIRWQDLVLSLVASAYGWFAMFWYDCFDEKSVFKALLPLTVSALVLVAVTVRKYIRQRRRNYAESANG